MKWLIPAKTFLLGEYAALSGGSAILLTTTPCFEISLTTSPSLAGIHPESPAALWWNKQGIKNYGLNWYDPYHGSGGLGASSAQFLGSYWASRKIRPITNTPIDMLEAYYQVSWSGKGIRPSGYDVIAQSHQGCVYINKINQQIESYHWPFNDLSLILLHTRNKLATHIHLENALVPNQKNELSETVDQAHIAFKEKSSSQLIRSINTYHSQLTQLDLVSPYTLQLIRELNHEFPEILAIKGCGALGSDVILIITKQNNSLILKNKLLLKNWLILASNENLFETQKSQ